MKKLIILTIALILSSCGIHNRSINKKEQNSSYKIIANEGTICLSRVGKHTLKGVYYPLNSRCKSSSIYNWKLNSIDFSVDANKVTVQSYSLYKQNSTKRAKKDCAGAGVKVNSVNTPNTPLVVYWDKVKLTTLNRVGSKACFKRVGNSVIKRKF